MAKFGAKYPVFAVINSEPSSALPTYGTGFNIGGMVSANLTINYAAGQLYADDKLKEDVNEFSSGTLAIETDDITNNAAATIYGATIESGAIKYVDTDTPPVGGFGYITAKMKDGVKSYVAYFYPKVKGVRGNDNASTKNNSISFGTNTVTFTVYAPNSGGYQYTQEFSNEADAKAWIDNKLNVATNYEINVQCNGAGSGDDASPIGPHYVGAGESFGIAITGTPTALYDNGTDKKSSIASGKYTLTNVTANHNIAVVF